MFKWGCESDGNKGSMVCRILCVWFEGWLVRAFRGEEESMPRAPGLSQNPSPAHQACQGAQSGQCTWATLSRPHLPDGERLPQTAQAEPSLSQAFPQRTWAWLRWTQKKGATDSLRKNFRTLTEKQGRSCFPPAPPCFPWKWKLSALTCPLLTPS